MFEKRYSRIVFLHDQLQLFYSFFLPIYLEEINLHSLPAPDILQIEYLFALLDHEKPHRPEVHKSKARQACDMMNIRYGLYLDEMVMLSDFPKKLSIVF